MTAERDNKVKNLAIEAIEYYIDGICAGDIYGTDSDIDLLRTAIDMIKNK